MKRAWRLMALLSILAVVGAACGNSSDTTSNGTPQPTATKPAVKVALLYDLGGRGDKSFNDAAAAGLDKAKSQFNIDAKELQPNSGGTNRTELIDLAASGGYPLMIGVGFLYAPNIGAAAAKYPDIKFGDVDGFIDHTTCDTCKDETPDGNLSSLLFAENEGSYLVGVAAALKSTSHHIGFIGGVEIDLIKKFEAGYVAGAMSVDPSIKIDIKYLTQPPDFGGFNAPDKAQVAAQGMYQAGADVVYHAAGGSGAGLFKAAEEYSTQNDTHVWAIGVDSDQYLTAPPDQQPYILTSMLKRVDVAVYETIKDFVNGDFQGGIRTFDLKADGVGYSTSGGFVDDIKTQIEQAKQDIISGKITVPTAPTG
jgi:basic membrane protein A and related proteins